MRIIYDILIFKDQLKKIRKYRGYKTQISAADKIGVSRQVWSLWEKGKRYPNLLQLKAITDLFNINIQFFFIDNANPGEFENI